MWTRGNCQRKFCEKFHSLVTKINIQVSENFVSVINELSAAVPPTFRGYSWFLAKDDRPFRGTAINVHSNWAKLVTKVPDVDKEMDMELIHLRVSTLPTLHIIGAYLDSKPTVGHAAHVQARLEEKIEEIKAWGEELGTSTVT